MTKELGNVYQEKKGDCRFFEVVGSWEENSPASMEEFLSDAPIIPYNVLILADVEDPSKTVGVAENVVKEDYLLVQ